MWFYEDHVSDKLRSKEIWERSTFVFLNSLNTPRKHILNNTQLQLQYDPSSLRSGKPLRRGNASFLVFCTSSSFHVRPFSSVPAPVLSCFALWSELAHIQQVMCWDQGSLLILGHSVSLYATAQGFNFTFSLTQLPFSVRIGMVKLEISRHLLSNSIKCGL